MKIKKLLMMAAGGSSDYMSKVLSLKPLAFWPLNEKSGSVAYDRSGNGYNGAHDTDTILGTAGLGGQTAATYLAGAATNIYSAGFAGAFSGVAGSVFCWAKIAASEWADGIGRTMGYFLVDANNIIYIEKRTTANNLRAIYSAGGTAKGVGFSTSGNLNWFHFGITWDKAADQVKVYYNGAQQGATQTSLGIWAGSLAAANTAIGNTKGDGTGTAFIGTIQYMAVWTRALLATEVASLYSFFSVARFEIIAYGDSKTVSNIYQPTLVNELSESLYYVTTTTLAAAGRTAALGAAAIDAELSGTTAKPTYVLFNLGSSDSSGLPTEAAWKTDAGYILSAIHAKWPAAVIYMMRPWRRSYGAECNTVASWIADLVAARDYCYAGPDERVFLENGDDGVTYTSDGVHPNVAGYALTATQWQTAIGL